MAEIVIALAVWIAGVGTSGQANSDWQELRNAYLPAACEIFEDGSGTCHFTGTGTLDFPAFPMNNGEDGFELPSWRSPSIPHYGRN